MFDFTAERTLKSVDESLSKLGVDYFDVLQVIGMSLFPLKFLRCLIEIYEFYTYCKND